MFTNVIVAFEAEAKPLVDSFSLVKCMDREMNDTHFTIYQGDDMRLVISGMGIEKAQMATKMMLEDDLGGRWLNFGVAGSAGYSVGELVWINEVVEPVSGVAWKLLNPADGLNSYARLYSVARPQFQYQGDVIYDMEAAGIACSLSEAGRLDQLSCLKLISDGPDNSERLHLKEIKRLIRDSATSIANEIKLILDER